MNPCPYPPIGQLVNLDSHQMHLYSLGQGSPTVVFEAGGMSWSLDWYPIQIEVASFTRTCSYDRAGFGWSKPGPKPRSSAQIVAELHTLLGRAEIPKPFILVGASFGGHTARLYACQYPLETAGIILLDARHETISERMPPAWQKSEQNGSGMLQGMLLASRLGALKAIGKFAGDKVMPPIVKQLPPELQRCYLEVGLQPNFFQANLDEYAAIRESDQQLAESGFLGRIPLTVIRHGLPTMFARMPASQRQQAEQAWQTLQADLVRLSSNGRLLVADNSGHNIPADQPEVVIQAVREMVDTVRDNEKTISG